MAYAPPILNDVQNDLTGTSATLNITPPTDLGYASTEVYYRKFGGPNGLPEESWSAGGSYVGVPGTPGNFVQGGLDNDSLYEFVLYADYGIGYSPPSIARRIVTTTDSKPVAERIINDVAAWLNAISTVDGYSHTISQVKVIRTAGQAQLDEYPGAIVYVDFDSYNDSHPVGAITHHINIVVEGWVASYEETDLLDELELWAADIERALLEGRRRSGQARTTSIKMVRRALTEGGEPYGGIIFEVDVHYVTDFGNPYQRR